MNLQAKIKRDINSHALMACHDLNGELASIDFKALSRHSDDGGEAAYTVENGVATIDIRGLLVPETSSDYRSWGVTGYANLANYIQQANDDYTVTSIILDIDSVGGYVKGQHLVDEAIADSTKPIQTFVSGNAYSAAYRIAVMTDRIVAAQFAGIGSIGTIVKHTEQVSRLKQIGITVTNIRSGKWKAVFGDDEPLTDEQLAEIQSGVDANAQEFFEHVASYRGLNADTIASLEGRCFDATRAKELGLIDEIADSVSTSSQATQSNNNPEEYDLNELEKAQAKIAELEKSEAQAKQEAVDAKAAALAAQNKLAESQASTRQAAIDKLAADTGRTFTDEQTDAFKAMDEAQFAVAEFMAKPIEAKAPELPDGLDKAQATNGREGGESAIMAAVNAAKAQGAK
ncbi:S49 family peptidase [Psychrobacter sp. T6-5]|uniref:S49 family peptidase n=1 Tax=Psychrobacter sp. T6-5 TaxID=3457451 RepID=UPI003FD56F54